MISTMLVGISGTQFSRAAAEYAVQLARQACSGLIGVGVVDVAHLCPLESVPLGAGDFKRQRDEAVLSAARERVSGLLSDFQRQCDEAEVRVQTLNLDGTPAAVLATESQRADLLVVGKKHLPEKDWEASSQTLASILHQTPRPVLCVPSAQVDGRAVLIAYDGFPPSAKSVQHFVTSGLAIDRTVHLLTVGAGGDPVAQRALEFLASHKIQAQPHIEGNGYVPDRILELATAIDAGLIVMGAYGRQRFQEFVFGSVTKRVLGTTTIPLFLYH
jgi:nucleotide-binding universal stress UspA family protein